MECCAYIYILIIAIEIIMAICNIKSLKIIFSSKIYFVSRKNVIFCYTYFMYISDCGKINYKLALYEVIRNRLNVKKRKIVYY